MQKSIKITEYLKECDNECNALIKNAEQAIKDFTAETQSRFNNSIDGNIYATFGEYLYNALGKKINSQNKNIPIKAWIERNKDRLAKKDKEGKDIPIDSEKELHSRFVDIARRNNYWTSSNRKTYNITHAITGKRFGMGYVTEGGTIQCVNIPTDRLFFYLTQEHVDLISNKEKRACAQDFLTFRDSFMKIRDELAKKEIIDELAIEANLAIFKEVSVADVIRKNLYGGSNSKKYLIHEDNAKSKINKAEVRMTNVGMFRHGDKIEDLINTDSRNLKDDFKGSLHTEPHAIQLSIINRNKADEIVYFGGIRFQEKESLTPLNAAKIKDTHNICYFDPDVSVGYSYGRGVSDIFKNSKKTGPAAGFILNWIDVLSDKRIADAIDQRIKFFENASKTLHYLKKKHAKLVFIHGIF